MHEMSYIARIVNLALDTLGESKDIKVKKLEIEIGKTSGIMPFYMHKYYPEAIKGTILEGSELTCEEVPVKALCEECGKEYYPSRENRYLCPHCNGRKAHIISGKGVVLKNIVVEDI